MKMVEDCELGTVPAMGARHECNVALDGFWWTVVYQRDENRCWGTMQEVKHYVGTKLKVEGGIYDSSHAS
ncbi:hypothetical protein E2I00_017680 [Balaenoptera physalus]|uniref:Uncharacterized protein n=1 Tax=Balaenoptera physalus TaxID=9770 RepID=A0A643BXC5_BALPH|nr:hypothetical protein E2I00_017680 [Balaenoptera physalus]